MTFSAESAIKKNALDKTLLIIKVSRRLFALDMKTVFERISAEQ